MQDKLFLGKPTASLLHYDRPQPPQTPLAAYVLEVLPAELERASKGETTLSQLAHAQQGLLKGERERILAIVDAHTARETQLDLLMLLGGYLMVKDQAFTMAPQLLLELLEENAPRHNLSRRLTYELIVDANTEAFVRTSGQIRTFSGGAVQRIERDFYIGHHFAETFMRDAYETVRDILQAPAQPDKLVAFDRALQSIQQFTLYMSAFARLPHAEYGYFRQFLVPYPDKVKNASGAFMPSPQLFELLLQKPGYAQTEYLWNNAPYFSHWAQPVLEQQQALSLAGQNFEDMVASGELFFTAAELLAFSAIVEQFIRFKLVHIKIASSKIPQAFPECPVVRRTELAHFSPLRKPTRTGEGAQQGTGGFPPQDFLGDGVRRLLDLQKRLRLSTS